jgi:hypothetical protein
VLDYRQAGPVSITGGTSNYIYPLSLNVGASTKCLVSVTGWMSATGFSGQNQTYPATKVSGAADPAFQSYGCYFPTPASGSSYTTCSYTWVATVTPSTVYQFGCNLYAANANSGGYCAVAVSCH